MDQLVLLVLAFLRTEVPPWHHAWRGEHPVHTQLRYWDVATDIARAADEAPLDEGVEWTALLLAETAVAEGAMREDVDACRKAGPGGRVPAWSLFGLARPRALVCRDRLAAARLAREELRRSWRACRGRPPSERLAYYLSGRCDRGLREARRRYMRLPSAMRP
jgi:hypothetical protein